MSRDEQVYLNALARTDGKAITLDDAAGLMDPNGRTPPAVPRMRDVKLCTPATVELIKLVDGLIHEHREVAVMLKRYDGDQETQALGSIQHGFPGAFEPAMGKPKARSRDELPLRDVWFGAWEKRPESCATATGSRQRVRCSSRRTSTRITVSSSRAGANSTSNSSWELCRMSGTRACSTRSSNGLYFIRRTSVSLNSWWTLSRWSSRRFRRTESSRRRRPSDITGRRSSSSGNTSRGSALCEELCERLPSTRTSGLTSTRGGCSRLLGGSTNRWRLIAEEARPGWPAPGTAGEKDGDGDRSGGASSNGLPRFRVDWQELMEAFELGAANQHDLFDHLLSGRSRSPFDPSNSFSSLQMAATALHRGALPATVVPIIERVLQRVLEIELERGEKETCVTPAAMALGYGGGLDVLVRVLQAIGNDPKLQRNFAWGASQGKMTVFSHLIQVTFPGKGETPAQFAEAARSAGIDERCLLAVAFYAPQWARHVQAALGWPVFEEAVWWFHAGTRRTTTGGSDTTCEKPGTPRSESRRRCRWKT